MSHLNNALVVEIPWQFQNVRTYLVQKIVDLREKLEQSEGELKRNEQAIKDYLAPYQTLQAPEASETLPVLSSFSK